MTSTIGRRSTVVAMASAAVAGGPFVRSARAAPISFKVAHPLAATHPTNLRLLEAADRIAKDTDGQVELRIFPNGQLGGEVDLLNQVRSGAVEMYVIGGLVVSSVVPMAALDGTGFAFSDYAQVWPAMDGKLGAFIRTALLNANLYAPKTVWDLGFRETTSSVRPINGVADFAGMKIRVPGAAAYTDLFKALGAAPTSIQFNEVYPALQTKIVDGQENPLGLIETSKFYEVQKYCSMTNHIWQGNWIVINNRAWRRLSETLQEKVETALNAAGQAQRADLAKLNQSYKDTIAKGGVAFNDVSTASFREHLVGAGYYAGIRRSLGDQAFELLQDATGTKLG